MNEQSIDGRILSYDEMMAKAKRWAVGIRNEAKSIAASFTKGKSTPTRICINGKKKGYIEKKLTTIGYRVRSKDGDIDRVSFQFPLHGIFIEYGVGRGQPRDQKKRTAMISYIRRQPVEWVDEPIDRHLNEFADMVAEYSGDRMLVNVWNSKIKK